MPQATSQPVATINNPAAVSPVTDTRWTGAQLMGYAVVLAIVSVIGGELLSWVLYVVAYQLTISFTESDPVGVGEAVGVSAKIIIVVVSWIVAVIMFVAGVIRLGVHK